MTSLQELFSFPSAVGLKERIAAACWREAKAIFNEPDTTDHHTQRIAWSIRVLRGKDAEAQVFAEMLRAVVTVRDTTNLSDAEIEATVKLTANHFATAGV